MTKYLTLFLLPLAAFCNDINNNITMAHAQSKTLGKVVMTNAQITQLSNQKQKIVSRLPGHVEKYFVTPGEQVKRGQKVVLIESIRLSKMTADFLALKQQAKAAREQLATARKLYAKGLISQNELNEKIIRSEEVLSQQNTLLSQLRSLGIDPSALKKATDKLILHAHADGVVGNIFVPLHSNVDAQEPLMSIVNQNTYYAVAYLSVKDALHVTPQTNGFVMFAGKSYKTHFIQLLPVIDEETQRAKVLFALDAHPKTLLINAFTQMQIALPPYTEAVTVKKSALTLFKGEWVVFVEARHRTEASKEERTSGKTEHKAEKAETDEASMPYTPRAVVPIAYFGDDVAVKGIKDGEAYVADGVYYVKSMLLKSEIGDDD
jgi:biotin carboxyl carrier protein